MGLGGIRGLASMGLEVLADKLLEERVGKLMGDELASAINLLAESLLLPDFAVLQRVRSGR